MCASRVRRIRGVGWLVSQEATSAEILRSFVGADMNMRSAWSRRCSGSSSSHETGDGGTNGTASIIHERQNRTIARTAVRTVATMSGTNVATTSSCVRTTCSSIRTAG